MPPKYQAPYCEQNDSLTILPACSSCRTKPKSRKGRGSCSYPGLAVATAGTTNESSHRNRPLLSQGDGSRHPGPLSLETSAASEDCGNAAPGHSPWTFASDINAAVTTKLGPPSADRPTLPHACDVPLFGLLGYPATRNQAIENVLPPREEADTLMDIYWRYIHPLEPFVDKRSLSLSYTQLFAGTSGDNDCSANDHILLSTLNAIFALATQLPESLAPKARQETSRTYFHRAWALLRPEAIIWEPASLEVVQCMLLLSRYLQLTNRSHQSWMAIGSAVRAAQSLGLDSQHAAASDGDALSGHRRRLWRCCVLMDRSVPHPHV